MKDGFAAPYSRAASPAVTVRDAFVTVMVPSFRTPPTALPNPPAWLPLRVQLMTVAVERGPFLMPPPPAPVEKTVEELLTELERVQADKAALEKKEQELKASVRKKLEQQAERRHERRREGLSQGCSAERRSGIPVGHAVATVHEPCGQEP